MSGTGLTIRETTIIQTFDAKTWHTMRCLRTSLRACPPPAIFEPGCGADPVGIDPRISKVLHTKGFCVTWG